MSEGISSLRKGNKALLHDRTRGNQHKVKYKKFYLNIRKHFFNCVAGQTLSLQPRDFLKSPLLEILRIQLDPDLAALAAPCLSTVIELDDRKWTLPT